MRRTVKEGLPKKLKPLSDSAYDRPRVCRIHTGTFGKGVDSPLGWMLWGADIRHGQEM